MFAVQGLFAQRESVRDGHLCVVIKIIRGMQEGYSVLGTLKSEIDI